MLPINIFNSTEPLTPPVEPESQVAPVDASSPRPMVCTAASETVMNAKTLPAAAGLTKFLPIPPNSILTTTIANAEATISIITVSNENRISAVVGKLIFAL